MHSPSTMARIRKCFTTRRDYGDRQVMEAEGLAKWPHAEFSFQARKIGKMRFKKGQTPFVVDYLKARGLEHKIWKDANGRLPSN